jgi:hypothetical protein
MPIATAIVTTSSKHETAIAGFSLRMVGNLLLFLCAVSLSLCTEVAAGMFPGILKKNALDFSGAGRSDHNDSEILKMTILGSSVAGRFEVTCRKRRQAQFD